MSADPAPFGEAQPWKVQDGEDGTYSINTGPFTLEMVTDDYQMACDICDAHNGIKTMTTETVNPKSEGRWTGEALQQWCGYPLDLDDANTIAGAYNAVVERLERELRELEAYASALEGEKQNLMDQAKKASGITDAPEHSVEEIATGIAEDIEGKLADGIYDNHSGNTESYEERIQTWKKLLLPALRNSKSVSLPSSPTEAEAGEKSFGEKEPEELTT